MSISAISGTGASISVGGAAGNQTNVEQLKAEEQKLQEELKQLERSNSGNDVGQEERALEQRISRIEQQIQQAQSSSSSSSAGQAPAAASSGAAAGTGSLLDTTA